MTVQVSLCLFAGVSFFRAPPGTRIISQQACKRRTVRPLFMGAESCEKSESFLATFGPKLWSITLFVHARYGAMKVLCTGLVEFGGVLVENSKAQCFIRYSQLTFFNLKKKSSGHPHPRPKNRTRSPSPARPTWHAAHNAKRPARPNNQYVWHSIWRYPTKRLRCQSNSRKTSWTHLRSSQTCWEVRRSVSLR